MKTNINRNEIINAEELFHSSCKKGQEMIRNRGKVEKLLMRLEHKLQGIPKLGNALAYIPKMGLLVNSWIRGEYTEVPVGILAAIIGVLVYFISPIDAIPDCIPGIGLLDDAAVAGGALHLVRDDIDEYMKWRISNGLDKETTTSIIRSEAVIE